MRADGVGTDDASHCERCDDRAGPRDEEKEVLPKGPPVLRAHDSAKSTWSRLARPYSV